MLKKTITYEDYNGVSQTKDFYFNLNKAELSKLQFLDNRGLDTAIAEITETQDMKRILEIFEQVIRISYGVRSEDGQRFIKSERLSDEFVQTDAYSELFYELATSPVEFAKFFEGIIPKSLAENPDVQKALDVSQFEDKELPEVVEDETKFDGAL